MSERIDPRLEVETKQHLLGELLPIQSVIVLRPHHLTENDAVRNALVGQLSLPTYTDRDTQPPYTAIRSIFARKDSTGYFQDVYGETMAQHATFEISKDSFLQQLSELADDTYIRLDLAPDGICNSCAIGKHCAGTNYLGYYEPTSTVDEETSCVDQVMTALESKGYIEGQHFFRQAVEHGLIDYGGRPLLSEEEGIPQMVTFNSLIVPTGVLRDIIRAGNLKT